MLLSPFLQRTAVTCPEPQLIWGKAELLAPKARQILPDDRRRRSGAGPQMAAPQRSTLRPCLEAWLLRLREEVQRNPAQTGRSRPGGGRVVARKRQGLHPGPGAATNLAQASGLL